MIRSSRLVSCATSITTMATIALAGSAAWAQEHVFIDLEPLIDLPTMATMDRQGVGHFGGVTAAMTIVDDDTDTDIYGFRFDFYGQGMVNDTIGLYGRIPVSFLTVEDD